jgi:hypothetical protein
MNQLQGGRQELYPRSATDGPVGLGSISVQAVLKARSTSLGPSRPPRVPSSATRTFKAALEGACSCREAGAERNMIH